ncbi:ABC transporter permease [Bacillus sp. CLL-7-23]|uniref:Transport permease protein n=1 Tax=Bacillus changyiensis TaxID=3004103 RepID=A0ABT4WZF5_9BACI|nr:ABC transporter permease [Bacillus changyiensis]MDA7025328.1 ABC transporter permease [Bacillus changyiensis]
MKEMFWLIKNTLYVTFKKKKNIILFLCLPLLGIFISIVAGQDHNGTNVKVGIVNHDDGQVATDTKGFLLGLDNMKVTSINQSEMKSKLAAGELDCVITIDKGFTQSVYEGKPDYIKISSIKGAEITGFVKSYLYHYINNIAAIGKTAKGDSKAFKKMYQHYQDATFKVDIHKVKDKHQNEMNYLMIGFLLMAMLFSAGSLSEILIKEKENRTYFRLLTTPITAKHYVMSNIIVCMLVVTCQIFFTITMIKHVFHIETGVPFWQMAVVLMLFGLSAIGLSLITVVFANNSKTVGALQNLIFTPTIMISGCYWPVEVMPTFAQKMANFLPQRWVLKTLEQLQEGQQLQHLYLNLLILFAFAVAFFLIVVYRFNHNNNVRNFG